MPLAKQGRRSERIHHEEHEGHEERNSAQAHIYNGASAKAERDSRESK